MNDWPVASKRSCRCSRTGPCDIVVDVEADRIEEAHDIGIPFAVKRSKPDVRPLCA